MNQKRLKSYIMPRDKAIRLSRLNSAAGTLRGNFLEKLKKAGTFFNNIETCYFLLVCAVIVYIFLWSLIDILQELNFRQFVFDSGIISLTMNSILHYPNIQYIMYMFGFSLLRILFSPLILIDGITGMLVIQEIFLGLPSLVLYKIARKKSLSPFVSMIIGLSYLLYFPLAGVNYYNFHFQAFFILLFLAGYYQYLNGKYVSSSILFFLSGVVRFPYLVYPAFFMLLILLSIVFKKANCTKESKSILAKYSAINFAIFSSMLLISFFLLFNSPYRIFQNIYPGGYFHISSGNIFINLSSHIDNKVLVMILLFSPLLFLPLKSFKWMLFLVPYLLVVFFSNYPAYYYPGFYHFQYIAAVAPFIFLGLIDGLRNFDKGETLPNKATGSFIYLKKIKRFAVSNRKPIAVITAVALFAIVFQPYSPANIYSTDPFDMNILHPNMAVYDSYINITNLIPGNNPYVIYQNNLPYVDVHDPALSCLAAFQAGEGFNATLTYPLQNLSMTSNVDYALGYQTGFSNHNRMDMCQAMNVLYSRGDYGIEAYQNGFILLSKNYTGTPEYFSPANPSFNCTVVSREKDNSLLIFYQPVLIPGTYTLNLTTPASLPTPQINDINITGTSFSSIYNVTQIHTITFQNEKILHLEFTSRSFFSEPAFAIKLPVQFYEQKVFISLFGPYD